MGHKAMDLAPGLDGLAVRGHQGDDADKLGLPLVIRHILHVFQQQLHSARIVQAFVKAVAGGIDTRLSVQSIHRNAGIICQSGQSRGLHDGIGLQEGILLEGGARLLHVDIHAQVRFQHQLNIEFFRDLADFHQLVLIFACQYYLHIPFLIQTGHPQSPLPGRASGPLPFRQRQ